MFSIIVSTRSRSHPDQPLTLLQYQLFNLVIRMVDIVWHFYSACHEERVTVLINKLQPCKSWVRLEEHDLNFMYNSVNWIHHNILVVAGIVAGLVKSRSLPITSYKLPWWSAFIVANTNYMILKAWSQRVILFLSLLLLWQKVFRLADWQLKWFNRNDLSRSLLIRDDNLKLNLLNRGVNNVLKTFFNIHFHLRQISTRLLQVRNFFWQNTAKPINLGTKLLFEFTHFFNDLLNFKLEIL